MSINHLVPTRAIQEAVKSREEEILDALAIDWRAGHPHITCPYPDHSPSRRWDDQKELAFCASIQGSHSINKAKESIDFEAAKFRAAELTAERRSYIPGVQDA